MELNHRSAVISAMPTPAAHAVQLSTRGMRHDNLQQHPPWRWEARATAGLEPRSPLSTRAAARQSECAITRSSTACIALRCTPVHMVTNKSQVLAPANRPRRVEYMTRVSVSSSGPPSFERFPCLDAGGLLLVGADRTVELEQQFGYGAADRPPRPWRPAGVDGSGVRVCFRPRQP